MAQRRRVHARKTQSNAVEIIAAEPASPEDRKSILLTAILLITAVALVFWQVRTFDFVSWDDNLNVYANPYLNPPSINHILYFWQHPYGYTYRPVAYTVWALLAFGAHLTHPITRPGIGAYSLDPSIFHIANVLLHLVNAFLVFVILRILIKNIWACAAGAFLFAVHPIQASVVAWVTGMNEVLFGFFALLAIWQYLLFVRVVNEKRANKSKYWYYGFATVFYVLALLTKPTAIVVPLIAWLIDWIVLRQDWKRSLIWLWPWIALIIPGIWMTIDARPIETGGVHTQLWVRPFVAGDALAFYLGKILFPYNLAPDYGRTPEVVIQKGTAYITTLVPVVLGFFLWKVRNKWPVVVAGIMIAVVALVPVLGLIPNSFQAFSTVTDRYMYIPMLGVAMAFAWIISQYEIKKPNRQWTAGLAALVLITLSVRSLGAIHYWQNDTTILKHTLKVNPSSWMAQNNLGNVYLSKNNPGKALPLYQEALKIHPNFAEAANNMGVTLAKLGKEADAIQAYREALQIKPNYADAANNLGIALNKTGDKSAAVTAYQNALAATPDSAVAHNNLGSALSKNGSLTEAEGEYRAAIKLNPAYAQAHGNLGVLLGMQGRHDEAIAELTETVRLDPKNTKAYNNLAFNEAQSGQLDAAMSNWQKALAINPNYADAHVNLAMAYSLKGQKDAAIAEYQKTLQLKPGDQRAQQALLRLESAK